MKLKLAVAAWTIVLFVVCQLSIPNVLHYIVAGIDTIDHPALIADKSIDKTIAYPHDTVTVTIEVEGIGQPFTEPDTIVTHPADLLIMMDCTDSYHLEIDTMKAEFSDLLANLTTAGLNLTVGFITFGEFVHLGQCPINTDGSVNTDAARQLSENVSGILKFIDGLMATGNWEPWGDAIWLGNNWISWRPYTYKIVVLATDEPCDEGRRVPGPLSRTTGKDSDYDGPLLWKQVADAGKDKIIYITIDGDARDGLTTDQLKKIALMTDGLYYNMTHALGEDFVKAIYNIITEVVKGEQMETSGYNVVVTDTVSSEVDIVSGSFSRMPSSQFTNPDGSVTLTWNLGDIKYDENVSITYEIQMLKCGVIQVNVDADVDYLDWQGNPASIQLPLPSVTVPCSTVESCSSNGTIKDSFYPYEDAYANGDCYKPLTLVNIYTVEDVIDWADSLNISELSIKTVRKNVLIDANGDLPVTIIWNQPLDVGLFDIVVDSDQNGLYDEGIDAIDDLDIDTAGFLVIPEYFLGTLMSLFSFLAAFGAFRLSRRSHTA